MPTGREVYLTADPPRSFLVGVIPGLGTVGRLVRYRAHFDHSSEDQKTEIMAHSRHSLRCVRKAWIRKKRAFVRFAVCDCFPITKLGIWLGFTGS
jgi:hypothetical protein